MNWKNTIEKAAEQAKAKRHFAEDFVYGDP